MPIAAIHLSVRAAQNVARQVASLIREKGSQRGAAKALGVSRWTLYSLANGRPGRRYPSSLRPLAAEAGLDFQVYLAEIHRISRGSWRCETCAKEQPCIWHTPLGLPFEP